MTSTTTITRAERDARAKAAAHLEDARRAVIALTHQLDEARADLLLAYADARRAGLVP
jgi:hypothetical protein